MGMHSDDRPLFVHAYITGAKSRENQIEELEKVAKSRGITLYD